MAVIAALARLLLPLGLLLPILLGALRLGDENLGWYGTRIGVALFATVFIALFIAAVWWTSRVLFRADVQRGAAEERVRWMNAELEQRADRTAELSRLNEELQRGPSDIHSLLTQRSRSLAAPRAAKVCAYSSSSKRVITWCTATPRGCIRILEHAQERDQVRAAAGEIVVRTSNLDDSRIRIEVADTGVGIDRDFVPSIFDAFAQGNRAGGASSGLGLGMEIYSFLRYDAASAQRFLVTVNLNSRATLPDVTVKFDHNVIAQLGLEAKDAKTPLILTDRLAPNDPNTATSCISEATSTGIGRRYPAAHRLLLRDQVARASGVRLLIHAIWTHALLIHRLGRARSL